MEHRLQAILWVKQRYNIFKYGTWSFLLLSIQNLQWSKVALISCSFFDSLKIYLNSKVRSQNLFISKYYNQFSIGLLCFSQSYGLLSFWNFNLVILLCGFNNYIYVCPCNRMEVYFISEASSSGKLLWMNSYLLACPRQDRWACGNEGHESSSEIYIQNHLVNEIFSPHLKLCPLCSTSIRSRLFFQGALLGAWLPLFIVMTSESFYRRMQLSSV